jgi:toxin FitB
VSGILLDTNVISELSPLRSAHDPRFVTWLEEQEAVASVYLSAMTVQEIARGIHLLNAKGATAKAEAISAFLEGLLAGFSDRILPLDVDTAREAGRLEALAIAAGHSPGVADAIIASAASLRGLTVVTHNLRHFQPFGIALMSPAELLA